MAARQVANILYLQNAIKLFTVFLQIISILAQADEDFPNEARLDTEKDQNYKNPCRLYLAESHLSIPKKPKYGLFAGIDYQINETFPFPEIGIPLVDFINGPWHDSNSKIFTYLENFFWTGEYAGTAKWLGNHSTTLFVPGLGTLANYHAGVQNIDWIQAAVLLRHQNQNNNNKLDRDNLGRGAIAPYDNMTLRASTNIPAGMELFAEFGDVRDDTKVDVFEQTITRWDYVDADKVIDRLLELFDTHQKDLMNTTLQEHIIDFVIDSVLFATTAGKHAKAIRSLIPGSLAKLRKAKQLGGSFQYRNQDMVKKLDWLEKNGVCVDNLRSGPSTLPNAGRGAFATRDIQKNDRISVSPMLLFVDDEMLNMYEIISRQLDHDGTVMTELEFNMSKPVGVQLITNYAFGHIESSVFLVPMAPMVNYINHGPPNKVNAALGWSNHDAIPNDDELHGKSLEEIRDEESPKIVMQIVATRDIEEGEEIFLDYGTDWEDAWEEYQEKFHKAFPDGKWPVQADDLAVDYNDKPYPVNLTSRDEFFPPNIFTACYLQIDDMPDGRPRKNKDEEEIVLWTGPAHYDDYNGQGLFVCDLIDRQDDPVMKYVYTVKAIIRGGPAKSQIEGVPHDAIVLAERPYTADIHNPVAFRRWISIPDGQFPQKWRNLR